MHCGSVNVKAFFKRIAEESKDPAAPREGAVVNRHAPIRVLFFFLVAVCGAPCQNPSSTHRLRGLQFDGSHSFELQRPEMGKWKSLPDAPSPIRPPARAQRFHTFGNDSAGALPGFCLSNCGHGYFTGKAPDFQTPLDKKRRNETERTYVTPGPRYAPSARGGFLDRASSAAAKIFDVPYGPGKGKANTPDFVGVLTSIASQAAYRAGHDPLLRLSRSLVRPPKATRGSASFKRFDQAPGKK
jgi:hypothetical protein